MRMRKFSKLSHHTPIVWKLPMHCFWSVISWDNARLKIASFKSEELNIQTPPRVLGQLSREKFNVTERARANSIQTQHVHDHSKCFTIPESYESKFLQRAKI